MTGGAGDLAARFLLRVHNAVASQHADSGELLQSAAGSGQYSLANIALYGYTHCAEEGGFELARYPAFVAWLKRVASVPNHIPMTESR